MLIGDRVKKARIAKNLSQSDLAVKLDVSYVSISGYENGNRIPSVEKLIKLCEILDLTPNYVLGYEKMYISENEESYKVHLSDTEIEFIKEIRKKQNLYKKIMAEPIRSVEIIDRNIIN